MLKSIMIAGMMVLAAGIAHARDNITVVGSSTVLPFASTVAEAFANNGFTSPTVESTGTGGGFKAFCAGIGENTPDIANASRTIKDSELQLCTENGVTPIEVKIGYDGIVLAGSKEGVQFDITKEQLFRALAKYSLTSDGSWIPNPHTKWSDIDPSLPDIAIQVFGPPPTSGTRDAFIELVFHSVCKNDYKQPDDMIKAEECNAINTATYIEAGENDNLLVQRIKSDPKIYAIFGHSFLENNQDTVQGINIGGVSPTTENILNGTYKVSRALYFYVKKEHVEFIPGLTDYVNLFLSDDMIGQDGEVTTNGLIPMSEDELVKVRDSVIAQIGE